MCPRWTVQDFVPASSITQFIMQYFPILQLNVWRWMINTEIWIILHTCYSMVQMMGLFQSLDVKLIVQSQKEWRWSRIKQKPANGSRYWEKDVLKNFQLHPLSFLVGFLYALAAFMCSYYPNDRKAINGSLCGTLKMPEGAGEDIGWVCVANSVSPWELDLLLEKLCIGGIFICIFFLLVWDIRSILSMLRRVAQVT